MDNFLQTWHQSAITSLGLFWMAFWAFGLGYLISAMIQVFVTKERMKSAMGETGAKSVGLATFFGFISSSCSFAALSTTRSLFSKGAGLIPSLAFLLASTNLVIELGIVIGVFLSWQFIVGEYLGGILLILSMWILVKLTKPKKLEKDARRIAQEKNTSSDEKKIPNWKKLIRSKKGWLQVARKYLMEWQMVWKDITIGFTVAGIIAVFVPKSFFQALFVNSGNPGLNFLDILAHAFIGPIAAFFTFIGSMGNIPLAAVLFSNGVSFAGVIAFIFSDLVVFPVLRIQIKYYGWKMALYILGVFLLSLVSTALLLHYGFAFLDLLPSSESAKIIVNREFFKIDSSFFFNIIFILVSLIAITLTIKAKTEKSKMKRSLSELILLGFASLSGLWLLIGLFIPLFS